MLFAARSVLEQEHPHWQAGGGGARQFIVPAGGETGHDCHHWRLTQPHGGLRSELSQHYTDWNQLIFD